MHWLRILTARHILLLSHMRARSTLLAHILGSHPQVCGYRELHQRYRGHRTLLRVKWDLLRSGAECGRSFRGGYVLDKVLHPLVRSPGVLRTPRVRPLLLLRRPEATLRSQIALWVEQAGRPYSPQLVAEATTYYTRQLRLLAQYAEQIRCGFLLVDSDQLIDNPAETLLRIQEWLRLSEPLSTDYERFSMTGRPYVGDCSEHIRLGTVRRTPGHAAIDLPADALRAARDAFEQCVRSLGVSPQRVGGASLC